MTKTTIEETVLRFPTRSDMKALAQECSNCLSVFIPLMAPRGIGPHLKAAMLDARIKLEEAGCQAEMFLEPLQQLGENLLQPAGNLSQGVAIYRAASQMSVFAVPYPIREDVIVSDRFHILPLLKATETDSEFYLLALSQKNARLIHCTRTSSQEVELPPSVPTNLLDFNQHDQPDHRLENRSQAGQKGKPHGSHPGMVVAFGTDSSSEQKDEYLYHFYNELDKQLQTLLRSNPLPLVIAGVDYEIALYHRVSEYPVLVPGGVQGSPDGIKGGGLHARALEVLEANSQGRAEKALAQYEKAGGDRISTALPEIVRNAFDGRVLYLFLAEGAEQPGWFDESTRKVHEKTNGRRGDLLNIAAIQSLLHGSEVFVLPQAIVPGGCRAAAMLRF